VGLVGREPDAAVFELVVGFPVVEFLFEAITDFEGIVGIYGDVSTVVEFVDV
jgi:hypothetical protein